MDLVVGVVDPLSPAMGPPMVVMVNVLMEVVEQGKMLQSISLTTSYLVPEMEEHFSMVNLLSITGVEGVGF